MNTDRGFSLTFGPNGPRFFNCIALGTGGRAIRGPHGWWVRRAGEQWRWRRDMPLTADH